VLDSNVLPILVRMLEDDNSGASESAVDALVELGKHSEHSDTGIMQMLM
jgi:hypothetical protein